MTLYLSYLLKACQIVFTTKNYLLSSIILALVFFSFLVYIPVRSIPGNDLAFQLSIYTPKDYFLLISLSLLTSLSVTMNTFAIKRQLNFKNGTSLLAQGGTGSLSGMIGSVFGTASCSACVGSLFGFLGVGGVLFLIKYRNVFTVVTVLLLIISLYFTSKRVLGICGIKIKPIKKKKK